MRRGEVLEDGSACHQVTHSENDTPFLRRALLVKSLLLVSILLLCAGAVTPLLTTHRFFVFSNTFSLVSGLRELAVGGEIAVALVIGVFSLGVPIVKIAVLWLASTMPSQGALLMIADKLGKWSMLEVFVAALLIVAVKLGPIANADLHYGAYLLAGSVLASGVASQLLTATGQIRPIFEGGATLTIGAVLGATCTALIVTVLHPELLSSEALAVSAQARCIGRVLDTDQRAGRANDSSAEYANELRAIVVEDCPEPFHNAFSAYIDAIERLAAVERRPPDTSTFIDRAKRLLGLERTREEALADIENAWADVEREAAEFGVRAETR
jgi:paraquat-inducible protein A